MENKFTGWVDVPLSPKGEKEVVDAGQLVKESGLVPEVAFTSLQKRAIMTLNAVLAEVGNLPSSIWNAWGAILISFILRFRLILCGSQSTSLGSSMKGKVQGLF